MNTSNADIYVVDSEYFQPELASIHLLRDGDSFALIDTGTSDSVPAVETALSTQGAKFEQVEWIILTHIHLDHAGGAGSLMQKCPNATLVVHPRGARHMVDPSKLIAGATAVYGEEQFAKLYGEVVPINENRVHTPRDEETIMLGTKALKFFDTPGHAAHHHCILDVDSNSVFTGDTLGVGYRALRNEHQAFVCPTTTPVQFDPAALHASIDRMMALNPSYFYLTHYSEVKPSTQMIASLHEQIDDYVMLTESAMQQGGESQLVNDITEYLVRRATNEVDGLAASVARQWLTLDANLNAQGLAFWWNHRRN